MNTILRLILSIALLSWMVTTAQGQSESRDGELQTLIREPEHPDPMVRTRAAGKLGAMQSQTAVDSLKQIAASADSQARTSAGAALGLIGTSALMALGELSDDPRDQVRMAAIVGLEGVGDRGR